MPGYLTSMSTTLIYLGSYYLAVLLVQCSIRNNATATTTPSRPELGYVFGSMAAPSTAQDPISARDPLLPALNTGALFLFWGSSSAPRVCRVTKCAPPKCKVREHPDASGSYSSPTPVLLARFASSSFFFISLVSPFQGQIAQHNLISSGGARLLIRYPRIPLLLADGFLSSRPFFCARSDSVPQRQATRRAAIVSL